MKIVSAEEIREIDLATSAKYGVPSLSLMENAGDAVAGFVLQRSLGDHPIGVICGRGNNGGDGFVAARKLYDAGRKISLLLLADPKELKGDAAQMFKRLPVRAVIAKNESELDKPAARAVLASPILIDAMLGTGFRPPVSGIYAAAIKRINSLFAKVIYAVDLPSGAVADDLGRQPNLELMVGAIVTFTAPKLAHVFAPWSFVETVVADIGTPAEAVKSKLNIEVITPRDLFRLLMPRPQDSNKGNFGHALIVAGSVGKSGAAALAGMGALRAGAGLVTVATAASALASVAGFTPELMTFPLPETSSGAISRRALKALLTLSEGKSVIAAGPGLGQASETVHFIHDLIKKPLVKKTQPALVLDADALNAFAGRSHLLDGRKRTLILTPHPGEMARLTGLSVAEVQKDRIKVARDFARRHHLFLVLKGQRTLVAEPDGKVWVNMTGNPGMATAGTGDVLTGIVAGLLAQNPDDPAIAAIGGVYLHGLAGDIAALKKFRGMIASDLLAALPEAYGELERRTMMRLTAINSPVRLGSGRGLL
jgi:NAD(P)H-hydrate epimerase